MTDTDSGWRKRQIALDVMAENARELGLDYKPNTITFRNDPATEVLRLSVDGIWVNPDVPIDDAAKLVLAAVGENIKVLVQTAVLAERNRTWTQEHWTEYERSIAATEREACAKLIKSAQGVIESTEIAHRPPMRDQLEVGRMVRVRLHALADLSDALAAHGIKE